MSSLFWATLNECTKVFLYLCFTGKLVLLEIMLTYFLCMFVFKLESKCCPLYIANYLKLLVTCPQKVHLVSWRMNRTKSGLACAYCVYLLRFIELYRVVYFSVSYGFFVSTLAKWLAGKTLWYLLCWKISPTKTADWRVIYCNGFIVSIPNT